MDADILNLAVTVSGAGEAEREILQTLCSAARQRWELRLRGGVTVEDCGEAFLCAAAYTAAADLAGSGSGAVSGFSAGSLSVKTASAGERSRSAEELRKTAERLMADFAEAEDFSFKGVRG